MNHRRFIKERGISPNKKLGQNFLVDERIADRIVEAAKISDDNVIEIGPGLGILTERIIKRTTKFTAIEKDHAMQDALKDLFPSLTMIDGDVLKVDWGCFGENLVVISNLPYQISTPILFTMLNIKNQIDRMVLMFQKEVGNRLVAKPGTKEYGVLTVLLGVDFDISRLFSVSSGAFYPAPKVESVVLFFRRRSEPKVKIANRELFTKIVKAAFGTRRKTLRNALKTYFPDVDKNVWQKIEQESGIDFSRRGETLTLQEFALLGTDLGGQATFDTTPTLARL